MAQESWEQKLDSIAADIARVLQAENRKCVFAESCTGGKMAAAMTTVPGISQFFCGSAVTYREDTKTQWLSVSESELAEHTAVSRFTTTKMAKSVLKKTPEADFAVAITGHLGPGVDEEIDGMIFIAVVGQSEPTMTEPTMTDARLQSPDRKSRQAEAAFVALNVFLSSISSDERYNQVRPS